MLDKAAVCFQLVHMAHATERGPEGTGVVTAARAVTSALGEDEATVRERIRRYMAVLPMGVNIGSQLPLLCGLIVTRAAGVIGSTLGESFTKLQGDLDSALFTQLYADTSAPNAWHEYEAVARAITTLTNP